MGRVRLGVRVRVRVRVRIRVSYVLHNVGVAPAQRRGRKWRDARGAGGGRREVAGVGRRLGQTDRQYVPVCRLGEAVEVRAVEIARGRASCDLARGGDLARGLVRVGVRVRV